MQSMRGLNWDAASNIAAGGQFIGDGLSPVEKISPAGLKLLMQRRLDR